MNIYQYTKNKDSVVGISGEDLIVGTIPITHGIFRRIQQQVKAGEAKLVPYVAPAPTWDQIRAQRDTLLKESDWTALADVDPKPSAEAWVQYRQALRELTVDYSSPEDVVWPTVPQ
jgi:hypothetical protein